MRIIISTHDHDADADDNTITYYMPIHAFLAFKELIAEEINKRTINDKAEESRDIRGTDSHSTD